MGKATEYQYDPAGRLITITNANTEITRFTYNTSGDLETLSDGKNQVTSWGYDEYGQVTNKVDDANDEILSYEYDANGRLTSRTSLEKGQTIFGYDDVGNLTSVNYPLSPDITYAYDANNRLTSMVDAAGTTSYGYTGFGALAWENGPEPGDDDKVARGVSPQNTNLLCAPLSLDCKRRANITQNSQVDSNGCRSLILYFEG